MSSILSIRLSSFVLSSLPSVLLSLPSSYSNASKLLLKRGKVNKIRQYHRQHLNKHSKIMEIKDVIYGNIVLPAHIVSIVETPLFHRLAFVQQLGTLPMLYPFAKPTRWEHCIGTYTRAQKMLDCLENNTPGESVPLLYRRAVEIAALLHDIGHGPFSHSWEYVCGGSFHHEENSFACIDEIFSQADHFGLCVLREQDNYGIELIKALIVGDMKRISKPLPDKYKYIFDIVNNKRCGVDVDKWDYLKRDHYYLKSLCCKQPNMNFEDIFLEARIAKDGSRIVYRYEDYDKIYALFSARWYFHLNCYRLPKVRAMENILRSIIERSPITINGYRLCDICADKDVNAFLELYDQKVLDLIKDDEESVYLTDVHRIVKVDGKQIEANDLLTSDKLIMVEDRICGPGIEMPTDEHFEFFGNICNKKCITRNNSITKICNYYQLE